MYNSYKHFLKLSFFSIPCIYLFINDIHMKLSLVPESSDIAFKQGTLLSAILGQQKFCPSLQK